MRWQISWEAIVVGVLVFTLWVGLDRLVPDQLELWDKLGLGKARAEDAPQWNPFRYFGEGSTAGWLFFAVRLLCSSLIVPPLEEIFYRSFLYRWILRHDFQTVPVGQFAWRPFIFTALIFGFAHNEWLAGVLCGFAYQALVCWKKRLGDAITAHALTNFLLGLWVVWKGAWHFW
jgi:CAAX prenyl protease-like protein